MRANKFSVSVLLALLMCSEARTQTAANDQNDCTAMEGNAKLAYGRIRDARLDQNEFRAVQASSQFWQIVEYGGAQCTMIRKMSAELIRTGLAHAPAKFTPLRVQSPTAENFSGGIKKGSTERSGGPEKVDVTEKPSPPPVEWPDLIETTTYGLMPVDRSESRWVVESLMNRTDDAFYADGSIVSSLTGSATGSGSSGYWATGSSGSSMGSTGSSGASGTSGSSAMELPDASQSIPKLPIPRPLDELN